MRRAIELTNLLTYSEIYGLGLTDADVIHLNAIHSLYDSKVSAEYIYKPTSRSFDLVMRFYENSNTIAAVSLAPTDAQAAQHGYPILSIDNKVYFKNLPRADDIKYVQILSKIVPNVGQGNVAIFNNVQEFKTVITASNFVGIRGLYNFPHNMVEACYWAMDGLKTYDVMGHTIEHLVEEMEDVPEYIQKIISVLQLPNDTRIAFTAKKTVYHGWRDTYSVQVDYYFTAPGDECYNFTDEGHFFSHLSDNTHRPRIIYVDKRATFPKDKNVIDTYRRGKDFITLDAPTIDMLMKRWMRKQQDIANELDAVQKLEKKLVGKIASLDEGESFSYNDITFTSQGFTYEDQELQDQHVKMAEVLRRFAGHYSEEHLNFDHVLDTWVSLVFVEALINKTTTGKIGDVDYTIGVSEVHSKSKATGKTTTSRTFKINGFRINKEEVQQVLARAICFPNTEEFTAFCKSVAACSLKYHRLLSSGLNIKVHDEIFDEMTEFKIDLDREKGRNFISLGGKKWKVGDTNRLLTILNAEKMSRVITTLLHPDIVGMSGQEIKDILETGKKALIEQRQKETELLSSTMQQFNIEELENTTCTNGKILSGYLVHGNMRDYLVEKTKCMVFEYPSGRYICMVDKGQNEHTNTARLVNRFYALANDSKLAKEISTL